MSIAIAGAALAVSAMSAIWQYVYRRGHDRRAHVGVSFHWLSDHAKVVLPGREPIAAGYHLVLTNRGPAAARNVDVLVRDADDIKLTLLDLQPEELPLSVLDAGGRYPIPWVIEPFTRHARRFSAALSWDDDDGHQHRVVPLRRGQLPPI